VAGILYRADGRILVTERTGDPAFVGLWEFPGGKIAAGEDPDAALVRELREELGVRPLARHPLIEVDHRYPDRHVSIAFFVVERWTGEPRGLDGQALRWVSADELRAEELLPADAPVLAALRAYCRSTVP